MSVILTKAQLLDLMRATRAEWGAVLEPISQEKMTQSGVVGAWSIKDVVFHCSAHAELFVQALAAVLHGEPVPPEVSDRTPLDERNQLHFQQSQQLSLAEVLLESQAVFRQLIELTEAHPESFFSEAQTLPGVSEPILISVSLQQVCHHYLDHLQIIRDGVKG